MKRIYIAAPYTTEDPEVFEIYQHTARYFGLLVAKLGGVPVMPTVNTGFGFKSIHNYTWWMNATDKLMQACDAVFFVPGALDIIESKGCQTEKYNALDRRMKTIFDVTELRRYLKIIDSNVPTKAHENETNKPV